ncbi:uncharacterized protein [Hetaerina americana]|uniref:uncharacterized protein n=1 Tax=Hetaerina americana TaxID=62018 RepID=UPI003A7F556A
MALRRLVAMVIFWSEFWWALSEAPHPCFASEAVPINERRFFTFAPANVRSDPAVDCVFVFGSPPGSLLRLGLYDLRTKGPQVFLSQDSARLCGRDVIRVYDVGPQGLQLRAAYCGLLRRGKMLSMSSNMAVVTYTSDNNDPSNAFNLGVDAVLSETTQRATAAPCRDSYSPTAGSTPVVASPAATVDGGGGGDLEVLVTENPSLEDQYGDWGVASGDSESGEQGEPWYLDNGAVIPVTSTVGVSGTTPTPADGGVRGGEVDRGDGRAGVEPEEESTVVPPGGWAGPEVEGLEGEETKKVVAVYSNGTGDEDEDALAFYYYL